MFNVRSASAGCLLSLSLIAAPNLALAADGEAEQALAQALTECDLAQKERVAKQPLQAQIHIQRFRKHRDQALGIEPTVADDAEIAERVRRCDRLSAIVARSNQQYEQQQAAIDNVVEESTLYVRECKLGLETLQGGSVDERALRFANQALGRAEAHKESIQAESLAFSAFRDNLEHKSKAAMTANLVEGDACMESAGALIGAKRQELAKIGNALGPLTAKIQSSQQLCDLAVKTTGYVATDANFQNAQTLLRRARAQENDLRGQMRGNKTLSAHSESPQVKGLNSDLASVSDCVSKAETVVANMANAVQQRNQQLARERAERAAREKREAERLAQARAEAAKAAERAKADPTDRQKAEAREAARLREERLRAEAEAERLVKEREDRALAELERTGPGSVANRLEKARLEAQEATEAREAENDNKKPRSAKDLLSPWRR